MKKTRDAKSVGTSLKDHGFSPETEQEIDRLLRKYSHAQAVGVAVSLEDMAKRLKRGSKKLLRAMGGQIALPVSGLHKAQWN